MPHHGEAAAVAFVRALPSYTIYLEAGVYYAVNNNTGVLDFNGADPAVVAQACLTAGGAGTKIGMREANYVALTGVAATANDQSIYGLGRGTYWDATALLTGTHAFTIDGFTGCGLRNFAIETDAGGTLINHCVFINDGADDFHLIDLTIVDSDSDGIHIEGTTITQGHIHRCHIEGADEIGIMVDMDNLNFMYRLHIEDCDILACGTQGIHFAASGGNNFCAIVNNVVFNVISDGIYLLNTNHSSIRGNTVAYAGASGIYLFTNSDFNTVTGNTCTTNGQQGIRVRNADHNTVTGNSCNENTQNGIQLLTVTDLTVTGNTCNENSNSGIATLNVVDHCTITGNTCNKNVQHGINLSAANFNTVSGNTCTGNDSGDTNAFDGIFINGSDGNLISGNMCQLNDRHGIFVDGDSDNNKIHGNYLANNPNGDMTIGNAAADHTHIEFNTIEDGAIGDAGTLTRAAGNFDPSADGYIALIGAAPF